MTKKQIRYFLMAIALIIGVFQLLLNKQDDTFVVEKRNKMYERDYQNPFCKELGGITEYRLSDKTRVDCLTDEYAIEVDFAKKWAEGIGQGLHYGLMTNRKPAVALIVRTDKDNKFLKRLNSVAKEYNIKVFVIRD